MNKEIDVIPLNYHHKTQMLQTATDSTELLIKKNFNQLTSIEFESVS